MVNKLPCLSPNRYDIMVSDTDYQQLNINADTMLDNDYEPGNLFLNFIYTNSNGKKKKHLNKKNIYKCLFQFR